MVQVEGRGIDPDTKFTGEAQPAGHRGVRVWRRGRPAEPPGRALCCGRGRACLRGAAHGRPGPSTLTRLCWDRFPARLVSWTWRLTMAGPSQGPYSYPWWKGVCPEGRRGSVRTCPPRLHGQAWSSGPRTPHATAVPSAVGGGGGGGVC